MNPRLVWFALTTVILIAACTAPQTPMPAAPPALDASPPPSPTPAGPLVAPCELEPVIVPTRAPETPGYAELDPTTGLHMTGTPQEIDLDTYRLKITGKVEQPLSLGYDDLRCLPKLETHSVLTCPGFFQDEATWAGVRLSEILDLAQVHDDAAGLRLVGADGYRSYVQLSDARGEDALLAYQWEGQPLPILHGFPVRAVFPELTGNRWVKWLIEIEVE